jgi:tetratricopeptide (TPR) repeat protein
MATRVESDFAAMGFAPGSSAVPPGWVLHEKTGYYVHDELVIALFAHPGHMRRASGAVIEETDPSPPWCSDALGVMETLPAEDQCLRKLVGTLFSLSEVPDRLERIGAGNRQFKKLVLTLDTSRKLFLAGDRANAIKFRDKVSALIPDCIQQGDVLFEQERYTEAVECFKIAALVYLTSGKRFRLACGQILDRISFCYFMNKSFEKGLRIAEHALYVFVTCGEEVEWALITVVRNMGKCYRAMHRSEVAIICFHFCLDSASASDYVCVPEKQKRVIDGYNTGALLWMPDTDFIFLAENTMLVAMCMLALDRREPALKLCDTAFDMYMASKDSVRPVHAFVIMSISCYNSGAYAESAKYAHAVCVYALNLRLDKILAVGLFYGAHATAMCGRHKDAIEMFRRMEPLPVLSDEVRSGIPAKLMFADCLRQEKHTLEAIEVLFSVARSVPPGAELVCHNIVLASCFAEMRNLRDAQKHLALSQGHVPRSFALMRDELEVHVQQLAWELEDEALRASKELCPDFEPGAPPRLARARRRARAPPPRDPLGPSPPRGAPLGAPPPPPPPPAPPPAPAPAPAECCVCLAAEATVAFSPCFHQCVCAACSQGILAQSRECPICRSESDAAHEILNAGGACARCHAAPPTCAAAPCFHMQLCDECARAPAPPGARCAACAGPVARTHRVFA